MRSWVLGAGVMWALWTGVFAQAQMDDVTMPGGEKKAPPAVLSESEFKEWAAKPGAVVFDLKYRGLKVEDVYPSWAGFIDGFGDHPETPFIKSLSVPKNKCMQFNLPLLRGSEEGIVEYEGEAIKALYLDLDCDGKLGPGEKLEPAQKPEEGDEEWVFVTPDFTITASNGKKSLFRLIAEVDSGEKRIMGLLASFCVWEGEAQVAGTTTTLRLMDSNVDGSFLGVGEDEILLAKGSLSSQDDPFLSGRTSSSMTGLDKVLFQLLVPAGGKKMKSFLSGRPLSSLTNLDKEFYQLRFTGEGTKEKPLRAVLCRDTTPTGQIEFKVVQFSPETTILHTQIVSAETSSLLFDLRDPSAVIPQGRYRIESGALVFGKQESGSVSFEGGPEFRVVAGQTTSVELGKPKLKVVAFEESNRDSDSVVEKTTFPRKTLVYLDVKLVGERGEEYGSLNERSENGRSAVPPKKPHLQIFGPDGKEVVSSDLEFG